jgi:nitric oxide reductase subunit C
MMLVVVVTLFVLERGTVSRNSVMAAGGDPVRGERLFGTLPCASCHNISRPWPGGDICPNLGNIAAEAARIVRRPDYHGRAKDAASYIRESIIDPNAYIVPGANYRQPDGQSVMPKDFAQTLSPLALDDLVAFLLTRR